MNTFRRSYDDPESYFGPIDDQPTAAEYETARRTLGPWASDEQITELAFSLMAESLALLDANADDHAADNFADRMEDWT
jgi:hypothetical protein